MLVQLRSSFTEIATTTFLEHRDRHEVQGRRVVFSIDETDLGRASRSVYGNSRSMVPVVFTIGREEKGGIICSRWSGFIMRPRIRSQTWLIQQLRPLYQIIEGFFPDVSRHASMKQHGI
jgi:hypothetical protein